MNDRGCVFSAEGSFLFKVHELYHQDIKKLIDIFHKQKLKKIYKNLFKCILYDKLFSFSSMLHCFIAIFKKFQMLHLKVKMTLYFHTFS